MKFAFLELKLIWHSFLTALFSSMAFLMQYAAKAIQVRYMIQQIIELMSTILYACINGMMDMSIFTNNLLDMVMV